MESGAKNMQKKELELNGASRPGRCVRRSLLWDHIVVRAERSKMRAQFHFFLFVQQRTKNCVLSFGWLTKTALIKLSKTFLMLIWIFFSVIHATLACRHT